MLPLVLLLLTSWIQSRPIDGMPVTQLPTTPGCPPPNCIYQSKCYENGEEISRGHDGNNWCYGLMCSDGGTIAWDNFNCGSTTTDAPPTTSPSPSTTATTAPLTTAPTPTTPLGCSHNGDWYPPGGEISRGLGGKGWCYGMICGEDGQVISWDDWNCDESTPPPTPTTTPPQHGCFYNGKWYPPGKDISKGADGKGWCYGTYCTAKGTVVAWDDWNCDPTTSEPPSPTTTPASTTTHAPTPTTVPIPLGCFQNGAWYEPGSEISRESDGEGWCHGISCDSSGKVVAWDDWNCAKTEDPKPTAEAKGCYYENQWHPYGSIFEGADSSGCRFGALCGMDGKVTRWNEFNCKPNK